MMASALAEVTGTFLHKWPERENIAYFTKAVEELEATHPDIKIKMEAVAGEPYKASLHAAAAVQRGYRCR